MKTSISLALVVLARQVVCNSLGRENADKRIPEDCIHYYDNVHVESCEYVRDVFKISPQLFHEWNPSVGVDCSNWATGMTYCLETWSRYESRYDATATIVSSEPATTTTTTTTTTSSSKPSPTAWSYAGCWPENPEEPYVLYTNMSPAGGDPNLSISKCKDSCYHHFPSYRFAGLKDGNQCWCGAYAVGNISPNGTRDCNVPCSGDPSEICGGKGSLNVFSLNDNDSVVDRKICHRLLLPAAPSPARKASSPPAHKAAAA